MIKPFFKKYWPIFALVAITIFAFYIRSLNVVPDRILSFDPTFQYRFTKYFADWGFLPNWDELTYYVGRPIDNTLMGPLMLYLTVILYWILQPLLGFSLLTTCSYAAAIYGALICIPAFLIGRELSNKYGGLMCAFLIGTAPQILIRTFGSSYDTDQIAIFFLLLTMYLTIYALRKKNISSFSLALTGFAAFMVAWGLFIYSFAIVAFAVVVHLILSTLLMKKDHIKEGIEVRRTISESFKESFKDFKKNFYLMLGLFAAMTAVGFILKAGVLESLQSIVGFAGKAEAWIVNISIAELQAFNIFNLSGWLTATGNFVLGVQVLDITVFAMFLAFMGIALYATYKKDRWRFSFITTLILIAIYTTFRGIRFTEFTSALFLIVIGCGFGYFVEYMKRDDYLKVFSIGLGLCIVFIAGGIGMQLGNQLGPDMSQNWDDAWTFLRTQTPELSIVGTWWDPGHMISATAERRNFADGAHCPEPCMYNINDRITDLGKIMATTDESVSLELIKKYQGTSPKVYWIASDDLIGKYQWLQYFGTGCDARSDQNCQLYMQLPRSNIKYAEGSTPAVVYFNDVALIMTNMPIPVVINGKTATIVQEVIFYDQSGELQHFDISSPEIVGLLKPTIEDGLKLQLSDDVIPVSIWIPKDYSAIIVIPPTLRDTIFSKMFFYEGAGLEHFKQVFRNEQVKIYEVV